MRFQTMYVDMRPVAVKWLGILSCLAFIFLILTSMQPDLQRAVQQFVKVYEQSHESVRKGAGIQFWTTCVQSSSCWKTILFSWSASLLTKSLYLGGLTFGLICTFFGMYWRPEVVAMRDVRINSARVEESKVKSPRAPGRTI